MSGGHTNDPVAGALEVQKEFYDQRAPDYVDASRPLDRKAWGDTTPELAGDLVDRLGPGLVGRRVDHSTSHGRWTGTE